MKHILKTLLRLIPHICIVLSLMMITFFITDRYNRPMAFINNDITKALILVLSVLVIIESVCLIVYLRRQQAAAYKAALKGKEDSGEK